MEPTVTARTGSRTGRVAISAAAAALPSAGIAALVSLAAGALGVPQLPQLSPPAVALFAALAAAVAVVGWAVVRRRSRDPRHLLTRLVPTLLLVSFVPDVVLGVLTATTTGAGPVLALAAMHLTTVLVVVPVCLRLLPVAPARVARDAASARRIPASRTV